MVSLRAKIMKSILHKNNNLNPEINPHPIEKIKKFSKKFSDNHVPIGFKIIKCETENGTKYEKIVRKNVEHLDKAILFFHGGAYVAGLISFYRTFAKSFYKTANAELILLDYKCAPEYKFPTQLNEAIDLWKDLVFNKGYKSQNVIFGGDSAGANLGLGVMLKIRDDKLPMPAAAFFMSPWADMTASGESYIENYSKDIMFGKVGSKVDAKHRKTFISSDIYNCFVGDADRNNPYISPVFGEFYDFPPMMFVTGGNEVLLSDTLTIYENLKKYNVSVELEIRKGMFHTFAIYGFCMPEARQSFDKILEFIKKCFSDDNKNVRI